VEEARAAANELGFPVLLKAAAGGGGKGMRRVQSLEELEDAFGAAAAEAQAAFGDPSLYVESVIAPARHVEVQVLADMHGGVLTVGERECSVQRRHQKLIGNRSPALTAEQRGRELRRWPSARARRSATRTPHLRVPRRPDGAFPLIELNAWLQVEHPVSESSARHRHRARAARVASGDALR
jgi:acetyl-CoA carboxylase biotin carboxylase subunit